MHREHPLCIVRYSVRYIWLLIFPLLRNLFRLRLMPETALRWLQGAWFDILILLCILGFGWLRWYHRRFSVKNGDICVYEGFLLRHIRYIPLDALAALTIEHPFWLRPFDGVYVYADTVSGILKRNDLRLLLRRRDAAVFEPLLEMPERDCGLHYHVHPWRILLFSVVFSSSLSGALYTAAFWFQGGRISRTLIGELGLVQRLGEVSEEVAGHLTGIPPLAVTIGVVILSTWLMSFVNNLLRYGGFVMAARGRVLTVSSGILTKRRIRIKRERVNFLDIRQNLLTKLCRVYSLTVNCSGYGSRRGDIPVCLPLLKRKEIAETMPLIFPRTGLLDNQLRVPLTAWWGYVWPPVLWMAGIIPAAYILRRMFPAVESAIGFVQLMLLIPAVWKLLIQITALLTSGIGAEHGQICVWYCRGFVFHTITAGMDRIVKVRITQFPWQRWFGKCNVTVYFRGERIRRCTVKTLDAKRVRELFGAVKK